MKYGLMYYKATDNIGDDIQTYVAKKYLPQIDYYIDREALSCFVPKQKETVAMIMNGWFIHNKIAWPPSPYIKPLLISMHFKDLENTDVGDSYLKGYGGEVLKKYGPVGARDSETKKRLEKNGITSYFSGCMTLTLEKFENIQKKNKICIVDVSDEVTEKIRESTDTEIEILTHVLNSEESEKKSIEQRMNDVEILLKKYQEAKLVITTRLHVALPCVALGTPVIVVHKANFDKDRLGTFFEMFENYLEEDFLSMNIKDILQNPKANNNKYLEIKEDLNKRCIDFIENCRTSDLNELPEIEEYRQYAQKVEWYKGIYEKERLALENIEHKRVQEYKLYHKELEKIQKVNAELQEKENMLNIKLNDKIELQKELEKAKEELSNIYNSKGWKYLEKVRKVLYE